MAAVPKSAGPPPRLQLQRDRGQVLERRKHLTTITLKLETGPGGRGSRASQDDEDDDDDLDDDEEELLQFQRRRSLRIRYDHAAANKGDQSPSKSSSSSSEKADGSGGEKSGLDGATPGDADNDAKTNEQPIKCYLPEQIKPSMGVSVRCDLHDRIGSGSLSKLLLRVAPDS